MLWPVQIQLTHKRPNRGQTLYFADMRVRHGDTNAHLADTDVRVRVGYVSCHFLRPFPLLYCCLNGRASVSVGTELVCKGTKLNSGKSAITTSLPMSGY